MSERCPTCGEVNLWNGAACDECGHGEGEKMEPAILFVKPRAINQRDRKALQQAGVIVVEVENVADVKFTRAAAEISGSEMLNVALRAIRERQDTQIYEYLGREISAAVLKAKGQP